MRGVTINSKTLKLLANYLPTDVALKVAKELTMQEYEIRQDLKDTIIREFKAVVIPQFTFPGAEKLPANTIGLLDEKYDYQSLLDSYKAGEVEFTGIPKEYLI